ncbi:RNA 2'-phosphotransferase [Neorhodopirellula pilleata]|uniref:RNA 2'-phosphotransferase n=1 Tax=Neorhodopirellula pilleata TaxID=2714738 RepID=A0A5C6ABP8_9BACT|nr:RNA 2'-phosphotransferase [Neorhodopirellula pilleata]TWT96545.1 RNA 2'-phosphotransferase [Neorhodopirellula pilleata]
MNKRLTKISKYLTFVLRHEPQSIGLTPDAYGHVNIDELVQRANQAGKTITVEQVRQVLEQQEQPLFALSDDGQMIRAL